MAVNKLVDSTQLDADLTSVANAIRAKSGGSSQLAFPAGFVSAIGDIPSGGGDSETIDALVSGQMGNKSYTFTVSSMNSRVFANTKGAFSVTMPNLTQVNVTYAAEESEIVSFSAPLLTKITSGMFSKCRHLTSVSFPALTEIANTRAFGECTSLTSVCFPNALTGDESFYGCTALVSAVVGSLGTKWKQFLGCSSLEAIDISDGNINTMAQNCSALNTLVLRKSNGLIALAGTNAFSGTPFANGGTGGTIYIPKALYDHLGDGTSSDYQAATNWAILHGYGTITWAKIEGSIYETQYADGTPIT